MNGFPSAAAAALHSLSVSIRASSPQPLAEVYTMKCGEGVGAGVVVATAELVVVGAWRRWCVCVCACVYV